MTSLTNAREEFEEELKPTIVLGEEETTVETLEVLCAWVAFRNDHYSYEEEDKIYLKKGYTPGEYEEFLTKIDKNYDSGYGTQELFGHIWLTNGEWINRHEYDGSEHWEHVSSPDIPEGCEGPMVKSNGKQ